MLRDESRHTDTKVDIVSIFDLLRGTLRNSVPDVFCRIYRLLRLLVRLTGCEVQNFDELGFCCLDNPVDVNAG